MVLDDLLEVLEGARRYERYIASLCPFHEENRPSFMVWEDYYKCYSCGATGKTENLTHLIRGSRVHHQSQTRIFNPWLRWTKKYGRLGLALKAANSNLPSSYLSERGINESFQRKFKLGFLDDWYTFPFYNDGGKIIGSIARCGEENPSPAKYITPPRQNNRHLIYVPDWELLHKSRAVYVTFGILDAITLAINGMGAISIIGLFVDASAFDFLRKNIYIIPDQFEDKFALALAARLGWRGHAAKIAYPDGCKDINDVFCNHPSQLSSVLEGIQKCQSPGRMHPRSSPG